MKERARDGDSYSICCLNPTSLMDGRDGRSQEETAKQHAFRGFPFTAWFTFPWSYEDCYWENSSPDKGSWCFLGFTRSRENVKLCNTNDEKMIITITVSVSFTYILLPSKQWLFIIISQSSTFTCTQTFRLLSWFWSCWNYDVYMEHESACFSFPCIHDTIQVSDHLSVQACLGFDLAAWTLRILACL